MVPRRRLSNRHHVGDIEGFVEALGLRRPIVVGQSMGGLNSITYATHHSDRIRAMVRGSLSDVLTDEAAEKFARSLPDGRWVRVENSGHNVQGDNPRGLLDAMTAFFRET